ncbi:amino acid ABC transporter permease [Nocardioides sp. GY 10127]|nr:amino acid ABC transporter permease [Nocardioides sp. GY 10127]
MTVAVLGLVVAGLLSSPGWPRVKEYFFSPEAARESWRAVLEAMWLNVRLFVLCEIGILALGLLIAVARTTRSAWLAPVRVVAVVYTDVVRGIPTILLITMFGFGIPALQLQGLTNDRVVWAGVALVVSYSAYVSEVFRSGIESVHPSQVASARALGLSEGRILRHVVVPQAVRRIVPPLLNDFVSLQKDTALVSVLGVLDGVFWATNYANYNFNYTPMVVVAIYFIVLTVPLARLTDHLQKRVVERERAGAR